MNDNMHDKNYGHLNFINHKQGLKKGKGQVAQTSFARPTFLKSGFILLGKLHCGI